MKEATKEAKEKGRRFKNEIKETKDLAHEYFVPVYLKQFDIHPEVK